MKCIEEGSGELVISGGDGAVDFEMTDPALDAVAFAVDAAVPADRVDAICGGIVAYYRTVLAAFSEPWSNGQTEGQITKLKLVKRQMYGHAKLDLLRARVMGA